MKCIPGDYLMKLVEIMPRVHLCTLGISACLADISVWMTDHHLKLNLGKS